MSKEQNDIKCLFSMRLFSRLLSHPNVTSWHKYLRSRKKTLIMSDSRPLNLPRGKCVRFLYKWRRNLGTSAALSISADFCSACLALLESSPRNSPPCGRKILSENTPCEKQSDKSITRNSVNIEWSAIGLLRARRIVLIDLKDKL